MSFSLSALPALSNLPDLPIREILPRLVAHLEQHNNLVLVAPPGAGKTTLVPLALNQASFMQANGKGTKPKRILMLEPRRLAARSAAHRMANLLGEKTGEQVGYRVRFDSKISAKTTIEVITEGVFTRLLSQDPALEDVGAILFDEFHERSLEGDLALALCLDLQAGLREDLRLVPMSATLDGAAIADLMHAEILESQGRSFPVTTDYRNKKPDTPLEEAVFHALVHAIQDRDTRDILVFLPGQAEIERTALYLEKKRQKLGSTIEIHKLYGALSFQQQDAALAPSPQKNRKIILSSAIAETSLTIENITTVIDSGLARQPFFDPATGLTRLQTVRASKASITQRAGRAGRLGPGHAIRLWREEQTKALAPHAPPEIENADLADLLLTLADWGINDITQLQWLNPPPKPALHEAHHLLENLGALTAKGQLSAHGREMKKLPLPPRFAHMVLKAAAFSKQAATRAALLALLIQERGIGGFSIDLSERCQRALREKSKRSQHIIRMAEKIAQQAYACHNTHKGKTIAGDEQQKPQADETLPDDGILLSFAFRERMAQNRGVYHQKHQSVTRFRLANGSGAQIESDSPLSQAPFLVITDMSGKAGTARILSAAPLTRADILHYFAPHIEEKTESRFDVKTTTLTATTTSKLGAIALSKPKAMALDPQTTMDVFLQAVQTHGLNILPWQDNDIKLRRRLALLHHHQGPPWPPMDDESLLNTLEQWLAPCLTYGAQQHNTLAHLNKGQLGEALMGLAHYPAPSVLNALVPSHFTAPSGSSIPLRYEEEKTVLAIRPQELFGLDQHPSILNGQYPLEIELLSPAGRPIQITRDLPGFWRGSWADVRADMRGRYIKHPWPKNPLDAPPTQRLKGRKTP